MINLKHITLLSIGFVALTACGGDADNQTNTQSIGEETSPTSENLTEEEVIEMNTEEVLAEPDASFKVTQLVSYIASNYSELSITLFVLDNKDNVIARYYIKPNQSVSVSVQLLVVEQVVKMRWHFREYVKPEEVEIAGINTVNFSGIDGL